MNDDQSPAGEDSPRAGLGELGRTALAVFAVVAFVLGLQATLLKPYRIPSRSMVSTLKPGDRVVVSRQAGIDIGDIVVFPGPKSLVCSQPQKFDAPCAAPPTQKSEQTFIKRVVAGPGDTVSIANGRLVRNGKLVDEPYVVPCEEQACDLPAAITIPRGHFYVLGDNRGASDDSRYWGPVPQSWVSGQATGIYWPPKRFSSF